MSLAPTAALLLVCLAALVNGRPLYVCPHAGYASEEVALLGADEAVFVALPRGSDTRQHLLECSLLPGATIQRSIVFQGADRWWFEMSLPPITLLEVVCLHRPGDGGDGAVVTTPSVVCARCVHNSSDVSVVNDTNVEGQSENTLHADTGAQRGAARHRLRRSASERAGAKHRNAVPFVAASAVLAVALCVFLAVMCASKDKSPKASPRASSGDVSGLEARPNGTGTAEFPAWAKAPTPQPGESPLEEAASAPAAEAPTTSAPAAAAPEAAASVAAEPDGGAKIETTENDAAQTSNVDGSASPKLESIGAASPPRGSAGTGTPPLGSKAGDDIESQSPEQQPASPKSAKPVDSGDDGAASPGYEMVRHELDASIEESGDGVVHHEVEENSDGYVYAKVGGSCKKKIKKKKSDDGEGSNGDSDGDDGDSYEQVPTTGPPPSRVQASPKQANVGVDVVEDDPSYEAVKPASLPLNGRLRSDTDPTSRDRSVSELSPPGKTDAKTKSLQRSLPKPVGPPAFMVQSPHKAFVTSPAAASPDRFAAEPALEGGAERPVSNAYAAVDDNFRAAMKDDPYSRVFDDISPTTGTESAYSRTKGVNGHGGTSLASGKGDESLAAADQDGADAPYDDVLEVKRKLSDSGLSSPVKDARPGDMASAIPEGKEESAAEPICDALYARPVKTGGHSAAVTTEKIYEEPPELAPKQPGAEVLESSVPHYEAGKEDEPVEGIPMHPNGALYARPSKGKMEREVAPKLAPRTEDSEVLLPAEKEDPTYSSVKTEPDYAAVKNEGGYASVQDDEFKTLHGDLNLGESRSAKPRSKSQSSNRSDPAEEEGIETDHLYTVVDQEAIDQARKKVSSSPQMGRTSGQKSSKHGYAKVTADVLAAPEDPSAAIGDPGYQAVDPKLKDQLAKIRADSGATAMDSPKLATSKTVNRTRAQTIRLPDEPPPAVPTTQRPRANTMDSKLN